MGDHLLVGTVTGPDPMVFVHASRVAHTNGLFLLPYSPLVADKSC